MKIETRIQKTITLKNIIRKIKKKLKNAEFYLKEFRILKAKC